MGMPVFGRGLNKRVVGQFGFQQLRKNVYSVRSASLRACLRQSGVAHFQQLGGTFSLRSPMAKAMGYRVVP
jgi:hypothetical protein